MNGQPFPTQNEPTGDAAAVEPVQKPNWPLLSLLRFVLATIVFGSHIHNTFHCPEMAWATLAGPFAAVLAFFILSGYSIRHSLFRSREGFYARRINRIYPAFLLAFVLSLLLFAIGGPVIILPHHLIQLPDNIFHFLRHLMPVQAVLFAAPSWNTPLWSLGCEEIYYWICPLLLYLSRRHLWAIIGISFVIFCFTAIYRPYHYPELHGWMPATALLWFWLLGFLLAETPRDTAVHFALIFATTAALNQTKIFSGGQSIGALALTIAVLICQNNLQLPRKWHNFATRLGDFSYPLYIAHVPALFMGIALGIKHWALNGAFAFLICIVVFAVEYKIRKPTPR